MIGALSTKQPWKTFLNFPETLMDLSLIIVSFLHFSLLFFDHLNNDTIHNALFTKSYEFQQENKQTG